VGAAQRALRRQPQRAQQPSHADRRQAYAELAADQLANHVAGPQRERKAQLAGVVADDQGVQPAQLDALELGTRPWHRAGAQRLQTAFPVGSQPAEHGGAGHPERLGDGLWVGALLDLPDRTDAQLLKCLVVELAAVVVAHRRSQSRTTAPVQQPVNALVCPLPRSRPRRTSRGRGR
jgi:hypothetical protein